MVHLEMLLALLRLLEIESVTNCRQVQEGWHVERWWVIRVQRVDHLTYIISLSILWL